MLRVSEKKTDKLLIDKGSWTWQRHFSMNSKIGEGSLAYSMLSVISRL